jgi:hypothetical protein
MNHAILALALILALAPAGMAQDFTFSKTRYSSVQQPDETSVKLSITESDILIKGKPLSKKAPAIDMAIPFSSIDAMSYELTTRHRVSEGAAVMGYSLGVGAILMATKTKSHWLTIEHQESGVTQSTTLHLDKSEYERVIAALEAKTGKHVEILGSKTGSLSATAKRKDRRGPSVEAADAVPAPAPATAIASPAEPAPAPAAAVVSPARAARVGVPMGLTEAQVVALVGQPLRVSFLGGLQKRYDYSDRKIIFTDGNVSEVQ